MLGIATLLASWSFQLEAWRIGLSSLVLLSFFFELVVAQRAGRLGSSTWLGYGLRFVGVLAVALIILEPSRLERQPSQARTHVAVLVDHSASMSVADQSDGAPQPPRFEKLAQRWSEQSTPPDFKLYHFGEGLGPLSQSELFSGPPWEARSELAAGLRELGRRPEGLTGVLVLSDGLVVQNPSALTKLEEAVNALKLPVSFANIAGPKRRDLALVDPKIPEFCFAQNAQDFAVTLTKTGIEQRQFRAELWRDGKRLQDQQVSLSPGETQRNISFRHTPEQTGNFVYSIRVTPVDDEASTDNNAVYREVSVLRDKVRVLHVAGRPDWDVRALRTLLKRNPNVELLSYYILRDEEDQMRDDPTAPMSLIQFPHQELFEEELGSFDLIILQNFDATARANYNRNFGQFIIDGGTIAVIGGDLGLGGGDYSLPPFSDLLPCTPRVEDMQKGAFGSTLTPDGIRHPITAWMHALGPKAPQTPGTLPRLRLPHLDTLNRCDPLSQDRHGAKVLLKSSAAPNLPASPLLAVAEPGKGRLLELLTASSWRWGFAPELERLEGRSPYDRLWQEIIRWSLREDPHPLRVESERRLLQIGQTLRLRLRTHHRDGRPQAQVPVELTLKHGETVVAQTKLRSDEEGLAKWTWTAKARGNYQLIASRPDPNPASQAEPIRVTQEIFVSPTSPDLKALNPDPVEPKLMAIIEQSGGRYWRDREIPQAMVASAPTASPTQQELAGPGQSKTRALWSHPLIWLALMTLPAEWWIRRRKGQEGRFA